MALAIPGAGGVQRAFGTDAKSLQAGFASTRDPRGALAAARRQADCRRWKRGSALVGGDPGALDLAGPAVPGGLAIKIYPCCYALQRPISALAEPAGDGLDPGAVRRHRGAHARGDRGRRSSITGPTPACRASSAWIRVRRRAARPASRVRQLHRRGGPPPGRPQAHRPGGNRATPGGSWLLDGELAAEVHTGGEVLAVKQQFPPGAPRRPPADAELRAKLSDCVAGLDADPASWTWQTPRRCWRGSCPRTAAREPGRTARAGSPGQDSPGPGGQEHALPLAGLTVVALEQAVAAPFATRQLADLGARVIKVERPGTGDFARGFDTTVHGQASYFVWLNRGKQSIELDVKSADGSRCWPPWSAGPTSWCRTWRRGRPSASGLAQRSCANAIPRLIACSISGYGTGGPYRHKKAYDLLVQCETGLVSVTGTPEQPAKVAISVADIAAGMYAYSGVLTALYERERTGQGTSIEVAMLDALGEWMSQPVYYSVYGGQPPRRTGARHASIAPYGRTPRPAAEQVFLGLQNDREWAVLCEKILHRPDLVTDGRFRTNPDRVAHDAELTVILEDAFGAIPAAQLTAELDEAGIACARLRSPAEFAAHPQLAARDRWREVDTPGGPVRALLPPVSMPGREAAMGAVPALGEHTAAIRAELGFPPQ